MALPAHRRAELSYLAIHADATAIAVPSLLRGFDHQALAHELGGEVAAATGAPWHVLVAGDEVTRGSVDLRALCAPGTDADDRARLDAHQPGPRDVAVFLLSGGTTGLPKLIPRTHDDYAYNVRASSQVAGLDAGTRYLVSLPAGHNFPLACPESWAHCWRAARSSRCPRPSPCARSPPSRRRASRTPPSCPRWPGAGLSTPPPPAPASLPACACSR